LIVASAFITCELRNSAGKGRERGVRRQGVQHQAGGEAGRDAAEAAGKREGNGCGHAWLLGT
jgi:hypothetical protein